MRSYFCGIAAVALLAATSGRMAADEPQISEAIDAGGHTARVRQALFTRDGTAVVTVSEDKTVRVWNVADGTTRHVLRMPGTGPREGQLHAAALSPDGQTLAVGGYGLNGGLHFIYLISLQTNEITKVLNGHTDVIDALAFSPNGKKLLSGSHDQTARLWDVETRSTEHLLTGHTAEVWVVAFSPDGQLAVTAAPDKTARVWDLATGKQSAGLLGLTAAVRCAAWSMMDGLIVTAGDDGALRFHRKDGQPQYAFEGLGKRATTSLSVSTDSSRILFTQGDGDGACVAGLFDRGSKTVTTSFTGHGGPVLAGALSMDGSMAVTVSAARPEALVWQTTNGTLVQTLSTPVQANWSAAWSADGTRLAWGTTQAGPTLAADAPLERVFDLPSLRFGETPDQQSHRATLKGLDVRFSGFEDNAVLFENGTNDFVRVELPDNKDVVACVSVFPNHRAAVACQSGLYLYDTKSGKRLRDFMDHAGRVTALSSSPDGKRLLSAADDGTLRIWDLEHETPLLSLLPAGDDWIAWTPEGYYACSAGGERLAGWRIDNGLNKVASFVPAILTRKSLYRPDVLRQLLTAGSVTRAIETAGGAAETNIRNALPPTVQITAVQKPDAASGELTLEAVAIQQGSAPIVSMQVLLNGRPLGGRAGRLDFEKPAAQLRQDLPVTLVPGIVQDLVVRADTAYSYGVSSPVTPASPPAEAIPRVLHVLGIGIARYQDASLTCETATVDAKTIVEAFQQKSATAFDKVEARLLSGDQATRAGFLSAVTALRKAMKPRDSAVILFAGLSQIEDGGGFLLPFDADPTSLIVSGIPDSQLKSMLQGLPGNVLVVLEAPGLRPEASVVEDLARDLAHDDLGVLTIGVGQRMPGTADKPSPLAEALIEALSLKEGVSADGELSSLELVRHVRRRLSEQGLRAAIAVPGLARPWPLSKR